MLAFYLAVTGWLAVRRAPGAAGKLEVAAMVAPLGVVAAMTVFVLAVKVGPDGMRGGVPAPAPFVLAGVSVLAAGADLSVILRRGVKAGQRLARHLWRMCAGLLIASGSLFLGQPKVFPPFLRGSPVMFLPELFVFGMMIWWLFRVRRKKRRATLIVKATGAVVPQQG